MRLHFTKTARYILSRVEARMETRAAACLQDVRESTPDLKTALSLDWPVSPSWRDAGRSCRDTVPGMKRKVKEAGLRGSHDCAVLRGGNIQELLAHFH